MRYLILIIIGTFAGVFFAHLHNEIGAVVVALDAVGVDFYLQWLRFTLSKSRNPKSIGAVVFGGLLARAASLFLFLQIGTRWFKYNTPTFYLFAICILVMVPVLSLLAAYKFKPQRD